MQANGACHNTWASYRRISALLRKSADMSARTRARRLHKVSQTFVLRNPIDLIASRAFSQLWAQLRN